jgi:hypothetical protein
MGSAIAAVAAKKFCTHGSEAFLTVTRFNNYLQVIENMVAREGVEPPTPAFSVLRYIVF